MVKEMVVVSRVIRTLEREDESFEAQAIATLYGRELRRQTRKRFEAEGMIATLQGLSDLALKVKSQIETELAAAKSKEK